MKTRTQYMSDEERLDRIGEILAMAVVRMHHEKQQPRPNSSELREIGVKDTSIPEPMKPEEMFTLEYRVLKFIEKFKRVPISAVVNEFEINRTRAYRILKKLKDDSRIDSEGVRRGRVYCRKP